MIYFTIKLGTFAYLEVFPIYSVWQDLKRDIERLRKEFDDVQAAAVPMQHPNPYGSSTDPTANKEQQQQEALADSLHFGNPYETPGNPNYAAIGKLTKIFLNEHLVPHGPTLKK